MSGGPSSLGCLPCSIPQPAHPPAELEALVCQEAQCELQAREEEEVEEVD